MPIRSWLFARLGARYLLLALLASFAISNLLVLGGVLLVVSAVDMSGGDVLRVILVSQLAVLGVNLSQYRHAQRLLDPARRWLEGVRSPHTATAAWHALATFPRERLRSRRTYAEWAIAGVAGTAYGAYEVHEPFLSALPVLLPAALVIVVSVAFVRYFVLELAIEPMLERVAADLPETFRPTRPRSLRATLLVALPVMNLITGFVALAVSGDGLGSVGTGAVIAILTAGTVSLVLSLLVAESLLEPIAELRAGTERVADGDLTTRVLVTRTDETGDLAASFNQMVISIRENEALRAGFAAFVDPALVERIMHEGPELAGREADVTILCVDLRGFTALAERTSPSGSLEHLNEFYELIIPVILRHGGHVNTFVGDGLIAVFGAPVAVPDHADRAISAAREMDDVVHAGDHREPKFGIGINSGTVVVGTIGGAGRLAFTAIGDAVNTAARVEALTRETGDVVLVTESTRTLARGASARFEERRVVLLKGKSEEVKVYAALPPAVSARLRPAADPPPR